MPDLFEKIKQHDWNLYVCRKFNWFVESTQILANSGPVFEKTLGFDVSLANYLILNGDEYCSEKESEKFDAVFAKQFECDEKFFEKLSSKLFLLPKR